MSEEECCPKFDPKPWDGKVFEWKNKKFLKSRVFTLFFMPVNFGSVIKRLTEKVEKANAKMPDSYACQITLQSLTWIST